MRKAAQALLMLLAVLSASVALMVPAMAQTTVPGHTDRYDADGNGFPDAGVEVNGRYTGAYDDSDGTVCKLTVIYRGDFGNDPYLDSGVITNHYLCKGPDGTVPYYYQIVHESDPRYTGNPAWSVWGTWEFHVLTVGKLGGNLVRPYTA
jgi:hypothetical protein